MKPLCQCGSGLRSYWLYDADNIPLCRVCDHCRVRRLNEYRPDILTCSSREYGEQVDADY